MKAGNLFIAKFQQANFLLVFVILGTISGYHLNSVEEKRYDPLTLTATILLDGYKKFISPLQGRRICNFLPTCSRYSRLAVNRYGPFLGTIMTADRLLRCNPSAWAYLDKYYFGVQDGRICDPPENHYLFASPLFSEARLINRRDTFFQPQTFFIDFDSAIAFANYLFSEKDYENALIEYRRIIFFSDDSIKIDYCHTMIGEIYLIQNNFAQALKEFRKISNQELANYNLARTFFLASHYDSCRNYLKKTNYPERSETLYKLSYAKEHNFIKARELFNSYSLSLPRMKSRFLSTTLSAIIPGAGQIYAGRLGDGLYTLLTITSFGAISYLYKKESPNFKFPLFLSLTIIFHIGNIYGANIAARDYNQRQKAMAVKKLEEKISDYDFAPNYFRFFKK